MTAQVLFLLGAPAADLEVTVTIIRVLEVVVEEDSVMGIQMFAAVLPTMVEANSAALLSSPCLIWIQWPLD